MIKVVKPGFFTSIQDGGRPGYRHYGVPVSGVMDRASATLANEMLENDPDAALLEITMTGPELEFKAPTAIAICGAGIEVFINDQQQSMHAVLPIAPGDRLHFGRLEKGFRAYLAVKGGILTQPVLGSRSQYVPITSHSSIQEGWELPIESTADFKPKITAIKPAEGDGDELDVLPGPEFDLLESEALKQLLESPFTVAKENNRMAYQLQEPITGHSHTMLTSATLPGTVQYTPSGKLLILMCDAQTTGGYPRILQLTQESIARLAQKKTGDPLHFQVKED